MFFGNLGSTGFTPASTGDGNLPVARSVPSPPTHPVMNRPYPGTRTG